MTTTGAHDQPLVVIAEDEQAIATMLGIVVNEIGYRSMLVNNGAAALAAVQQLHPVLLITDLMMPELNGAELIAGLQAERAAGLRIIVVTVYASAETAAAADGVLLKPFELDALHALLLRVLPPL